MKKNSTTQKTPPKILEIDSIDTLTKLTQQTMTLEFTVDGSPVRLKCRRLTPREEELLVQKEREARPLRVPGTETYDNYSPAYLERVDRVTATVRAMVIYLGCPVVKAGSPNLKTPQEIYEYVQGLWTDWVLQLIALKIRNGGIGAIEAEVNERANFTTAPDSAQS